MIVIGKGKSSAEQMANVWFGEELHQRLWPNTLQHLGKQKTSLLLTSGWWGLARHFHYVPEISAAFFWTVPALFNHFLPYFYVIFLTILLFDRAERDDDRCKSKYGKYWKLYCEKVPYRVIPGIY